MSNSLYEQLKAGTSAEDIAAAFAEELNKAEEQLRAEQEAEEKAKAAAVAAERAREAAKLDEATDLLRALIAFISRYYPSFEFDEELTEDEYRAIAELMLLMLDLEAIKPPKKSFKLKASNEPVAKVEPNAPVTKTALDDPFAAFFKAFDL